MLENAKPSPTHYFLKRLADLGKLKRVYTQNIDDLETAAGLERVGSVLDAKAKGGYKRVVQLHGHLRKLFCGVCRYTTDFSKKVALIFQSEMRDIACPSCEKANAKRKGKRPRPVGKLQTCVVLQNGGPNPDGALISQFFEADTRRAPDLLLIIGTSLEIKAIKNFVTRLVRDMDVPTILMDLESVDFPGSNKIKYHLKGPCDLFVRHMTGLVSVSEVPSSDLDRYVLLVNDNTR